MRESRGFGTVALTGVALILALRATDAAAWGQEGHSIVAEIAQHRLTSQATGAVAALLGPNVSLASIASWADNQRSVHPETTNWHFVDIPLEQTNYDAAAVCAPDPEKGDCVVRELERLRTQMRCAAGADAQRDALRYAVHFVGDLHQPLHTVADQRGGNQLAVHGVMHGSTCRSHCELGADAANLHVVWDSTLIRRTVWDWGSYVTRLEDGLLASDEFRDGTAAAGSVADWAVQTHAAARAVWNVQLLGADGEIGDAYYAQVLPVLDRQLALAGVRLAAFLNASLAPGACPAAESAAARVSH